MGSSLQNTFLIQTEHWNQVTTKDPLIVTYKIKMQYKTIQTYKEILTTDVEEDYSTKPTIKSDISKNRHVPLLCRKWG